MKIQNSKIKLISKVVLTAIIFSLVSCGTKEDPTKNKNNVEENKKNDEENKKNDEE